jgi:carbon storage regulator
MLVLMRKVNEVVCIGNDVEVIVLAVKGNTVRIGINAPRNVTVDRQEVAERKRRERGTAGDVP